MEPMTITVTSWAAMGMLLVAAAFFTGTVKNLLTRSAQSVAKNSQNPKVFFSMGFFLLFMGLFFFTNVQALLWFSFTPLLLLVMSKIRNRRKNKNEIQNKN